MYIGGLLTSLDFVLYPYNPNYISCVVTEFLFCNTLFSNIYICIDIGDAIIKYRRVEIPFSG